MTRRPTKIEIVANHLRELGRITDATARAQYGALSLPMAIYALRHRRPDLLPKGKVIITVPRVDLMGNTFGEYRLVDRELSAHA